MVTGIFVVLGVLPYYNHRIIISMFCKKWIFFINKFKMCLNLTTVILKDVQNYFKFYYVQNIIQKLFQNYFIFYYVQKYKQRREGVNRRERRAQKEKEAKGRTGQIGKGRADREGKNRGRAGQIGKGREGNEKDGKGRAG